MKIATFQRNFAIEVHEWKNLVSKLALMKANEHWFVLKTERKGHPNPLEANLKLSSRYLPSTMDLYKTFQIHSTFSSLTFFSMQTLSSSQRVNIKCHCYIYIPFASRQSVYCVVKLIEPIKIVIILSCNPATFSIEKKMKIEKKI